MKKYLVPALLAALLAACGGGSSSAPVAAAPPAFDAFTTIISSTYIAQSDTAEPAAIDTIAVTSPDNTESAAI